MSMFDPSAVGRERTYSADGLDELGFVGVVALAAVVIIIALIGFAGVWEIGKWIGALL